MFHAAPWLNPNALPASYDQGRLLLARVLCWVSAWSESPLPGSLTRAAISCLTCHMAKAQWVRGNELSFSKLKFVESKQQIKITFQLILSLRKIWPSVQHQTAAEKYTEQEIRDKPQGRQREDNADRWVKVWEDSQQSCIQEIKPLCHLSGHMVSSRWQLIWFHYYYLVFCPSQQTLKFQKAFCSMPNSK